VVGKINLVEKIAELARIPMQEVDKLEDGVRRELRDTAAKDAMSRPMPLAAEAPAGAPPPAPKEIIKEGLSEYFIFTIEGTETIPNGCRSDCGAWKRWKFLQDSVSLPRAGIRPQLVRMYLLKNDKDSKLGTTPLPTAWSGSSATTAAGASASSWLSRSSTSPSVIRSNSISAPIRRGF